MLRHVFTTGHARGNARRTCQYGLRVYTVGVAASRDGNTVYTANQLKNYVSVIIPATGPQTGGTSVTITGTRFTGASAVHFGAVAAEVDH